MNRGELLQILGPLPQRVAPAAVVLDDVDCGDHIRQRIEYSLERHERAVAFVLKPKLPYSRAPAVICHHQHASQFDLGKSEVVGLSGDVNQATGPELAARGYVVFAPDALGFEERNWSSPTGRAEYFELATRLVRGETLLAKVLHDVSVAIDVLETLSDVDKERIGFLGHSYGGRMAIWAAAFDPRIKASVSNCGCVNYKRSFIREAGVQMEFCVPGFLRLGDVEDVARLVSPRALRIQATNADKWSAGAHELFEYAKPVFPDGRIELEVWPGGHIFTREMRDAGYDFLDRHLKRSESSPGSAGVAVGV